MAPRLACSPQHRRQQHRRETKTPTTRPRRLEFGDQKMSLHYREFSPDGILSGEQVDDPPDALTESSTAYPAWSDSSLPLGNTMPGLSRDRPPFLCNDPSYPGHSLPFSQWNVVPSRSPPPFSSPAAAPDRDDETDKIMQASLQVETGSTPPSSSERRWSATNEDWVKSPITDGETKEKEDCPLGNSSESGPSSSTSTTITTTLRVKKRRCISTYHDQAVRSIPPQFRPSQSGPGFVLPSLPPPPTVHLEDCNETSVLLSDEESQAEDSYVHVPPFDGENWESVYVPRR